MHTGETGKLVGTQRRSEICQNTSKNKRLALPVTCINIGRQHEFKRRQCHKMLVTRRLDWLGNLTYRIDRIFEQHLCIAGRAIRYHHRRHLIGER